MLQKITKTITLIALALCLVIPCVFLTRGEKVFSEADNRYLQERPEFFDGIVPQPDEVESYLRDRMALRQQLFSLYGALNLNVFGYLAHPLYESGLDGWAFFWYEKEEPDMEYLTKFADQVARMNERCKELGKTFVYVNTPDKKHVYSEYVPDYVPAPLNNFEYLAPLLAERNVPYLDLTEALVQARERDIQVFHKVFDAGHWNSEGALVGAQAIIAYLQNAGFVVEQPDIANDYEKIAQHFDYLPASVLPYPIDTYWYKHKEDGTQAIDVTETHEPVILDEHHNTHHIWQNDSCGNELNVLMFQGSYFNTQGTVLYNQFAQTECIHDYQNVFHLDDYLEQYDPDIVIFESADYSLYEYYYSFEATEDAAGE